MKTFIVRVWVEDDSVENLRGTVHDIESGERHTFQTPSDLISFLSLAQADSDLDHADR